MRFLVLYEELATYFLNCLNHLAKQHNCQILVIMKQINPVAPFDFGNTHPNITLIERETLQSNKLEQLISEFKPDFTYVSGWLYKPYLTCIRNLKLKQVIMGFDNQYNGSVRQKIGALYFRMHYKPIVHSAFVPGNKQALFARKLGFKEKAISKNVYCCDFELYSQFAQQSENEKAQNFPKRFLFVGRYIPEKGIQLLWECFTELQNEDPNEWELWCIGKGPLKPLNHPKIKHLGFVQPNKFLPIIKETGVFVLPSHFEPWGVVLHEFATAAYPIITTDAVGASEVFSVNEKNGYCITPNNKAALKQALKNIVSLNDNQLREMGAYSRSLAKRITPAVWTESLLKLIHEHAT